MQPPRTAPQRSSGRLGLLPLLTGAILIGCLVSCDPATQAPSTDATPSDVQRSKLTLKEIYGSSEHLDVVKSADRATLTINQYSDDSVTLRLDLKSKEGKALIDVLVDTTNFSSCPSGHKSVPQHSIIFAKKEKLLDLEIELSRFTCMTVRSKDGKLIGRFMCSMKLRSAFADLVGDATAERIE